MNAQKRRIYAAMLDSLAASFTRMGDTGQVAFSFNPHDVAEMLRECREEIAPGPGQSPKAPARSSDDTTS